MGPGGDDPDLDLVVLDSGTDSDAVVAVVIVQVVQVGLATGGGFGVVSGSVPQESVKLPRGC